MAKIAEAYVEISARLDKMHTDLNRARTDFTRAADQMQAKANSLSGSIANIKSAYAMASAFIAGAFVKSVVSAVNETANYLDALDEMSQKTGVAVETLSAFDLAAKKAGIDLNTFATSMRMLYRSANEANEGTKESADAYKKLGVNVRDAGGNLKSGVELFTEVAEAIDKIKNPAEKSALAMKVFGRAGAEMIPMLEGGADAIRGYIEEAKKLGLIFTQEEVDKGVAYADMMDAFNARLTALKRNLATKVIPTLTRFLSLLSGADLPEDMERSDIIKRMDVLREKLSESTKWFDKFKAKLGNESDWDFIDRFFGERQKRKIAELNAELEVLEFRLGMINKNRTTYSVDVTAKRPAAAEPTPSAKGLLGFGGAELYGGRRMVESAKMTPQELIGQFEEVRANIIDTRTEFSDMVYEMQTGWSGIISRFIQEGGNWGNFMKDMFEELFVSFTNMLARMAAEWMANQFLTMGASILGSGAVPNIGTPVGPSYARAAGTTININAVDAASFEALARRNPGVITGIVWEHGQYGRAS